MYHPELQSAITTTKEMIRRSSPLHPFDWAEKQIEPFMIREARYPMEDARSWITPLERILPHTTREKVEIPYDIALASDGQDFISSINTTYGIFLVSFRHESPYNGCWWQWEDYVGIIKDHEPDTRIYDIELVPIRATPAKSFKDIKRFAFFSDWWNEKIPWHSDISFAHIDDAATFLEDESIPQAYYMIREMFGHLLEWQDDEVGLTTQPPLYMAGYRGNGGIGISVYGWFSLHGFYSAHVWDSLESDYIPKRDSVILWGGTETAGPFTSSWNPDVEEVVLDDKWTDRYVYAPEGALWEE